MGAYLLGHALYFLTRENQWWTLFPGETEVGLRFSSTNHCPLATPETTPWGLLPAVRCPPLPSSHTPAEVSPSPSVGWAGLRYCWVSHEAIPAGTVFQADREVVQLLCSSRVYHIEQASCVYMDVTKLILYHLMCRCCFGMNFPWLPGLLGDEETLGETPLGATSILHLAHPVPL